MSQSHKHPEELISYKNVIFKMFFSHEVTEVYHYEVMTEPVSELRHG